MHVTEFSILNLFKKNGHKELSTTEIIHEIYPDEYGEIEDILSSQFTHGDEVNSAKRSKAKLHRKVLHHLNKLVSEEILKIARQGPKGQKFFALNLAYGQEIEIERYKRKIIISQPTIPSLPIEGLEKDGIVKRYEPENWINRLNSVLLNAEMFDKEEDLFEALTSSFLNVNDVVGIFNVEFIFQNKSIEKISEILYFIERQCEDYGKRCSLTLNFSHIFNERKVQDSLRVFLSQKLKNVNVILDMKYREIKEFTTLLESIANDFSDAGCGLYIKNDDLYEAPFILGAAGPYTFDEKDWFNYMREFNARVPVIACCQSTITIDVYKLFQNHNPHEIRNLIINTLKTLLYANSLQRRKSQDYFDRYMRINRQFYKEFFVNSRNFIRFWNYGWKQPDIDQENVIELIKSTKSEADKFCATEEVIYKSCGMPTRFKVGFACSIEGESRSKRKRIIIDDHKELQKFSENIKHKEILFKYFDGGDIINIHKRNRIKGSDFVRELISMTQTHKLPFIHYNLKGDEEVKLTNFFE